VYDTGFDPTYVGLYETARPYLMQPNAPISSVAIYAADLCNYDGTVGCNLAPNTVLSWNAYNQGKGASVIGNTAHFLVNAPYANSVYNSPWGNVGRNTLRDSDTNLGNFQISKDTNITERFKVRFDVSFLNVFNHPNFGSVDPFVEDAGYTGEAHGFALPSLTSGGDRLIKFGVKVLF
jgi:hypothetical protein